MHLIIITKKKKFLNFEFIIIYFVNINKKICLHLSAVNIILAKSFKKTGKSTFLK